MMVLLFCHVIMVTHVTTRSTTNLMVNAGIHQNAKYVINLVTLLSIARNSTPVMPRLIVPPHHKSRILNGLLTLLLLTISPVILQNYMFTLNMMVLMRLSLVMDQVCVFHILDHSHFIHPLVPFISLILFAFRVYTKILFMFIILLSKIIFSLNFTHSSFLSRIRSRGAVLFKGVCENGVYTLPDSPVSSPKLVTNMYERMSKTCYTNYKVFFTFKKTQRSSTLSLYLLFNQYNL